MIVAKTNFPISDVHNRILRNRFVMDQNGHCQSYFRAEITRKPHLVQILERLLETLN